jgi:hypothetical protein
MGLADIDDEELDIFAVRRVQPFNVRCARRKRRSGVAGHNQANGLLTPEG